eukprot:6643287-Alexandrium_andersonii.AAC.1
MCIRDSQSAIRQSAIRAIPCYWSARGQLIRNPAIRNLADHYRLSCASPEEGPVGVFILGDGGLAR